MASHYNINVAILGPVSAGKSTFMNSLFVKQFSDMKIKRTTMTPQVYSETDELKLSKKCIDKIKNQNSDINNSLIQKSENNEEITYDEISNTIEYQVPRVHNLHELPDNVTLRVYDIPGLNDARTQELYFQYMDNKFHEWDIIIMVIDINSAMNTDGEVRILKKIIENCKKNQEKYDIQNKIFILANKVDDLEHDAKWGLRIVDEEYVDMYNQIKKQVKHIIDEINPTQEYEILPISAEDAFIYRMYDVYPNVVLDDKHINKFGHNEFGKSRWNRFNKEEKTKHMREIMSKIDINDSLQLTGFNYFKELFQNSLNSYNQNIFIRNHIMYECNSLITNFNGNGKFSQTLTNDEINKLQDSDDDTSDDDTSSVNENNSVHTIKFYNENNNNNDINTYLINYHTLYQKIIKLNKIYNNDEWQLENLNKFYDILTKFIDKYKEPYFILPKNKIANLDENSVIELENKQRLCQLYMNKFGEDFDKLFKIHRNITKLLNKYYVDNIKKNTSTFTKLLSYFRNLFNNGFKAHISLTKKLFTNEEIMNKKAEDIINLLKEYISQGLITKTDEIEIISSLLHSIYYKISKNEKIGYIDDDNIPEYVYYADLFWTKQNLKYDKVNEIINDLGFRAKQNVFLKIHPNNKDKFTTYPIYDVNKSLEAYYMSLLT